MKKLVDVFNKNATEEVRASLDEYEGYQLFSLRIWVEVDDGQRIPTKKGLSLKVEQFPEFRAAVGRLEAAILEAGLLDEEDL